MNVTSKGQVTIPVEIRRQLGIRAGSRVGFKVRRGEVVLSKLPGDREKGLEKGREIVRRLRGKGSVRMTTDEILALTRRG